ncbi:hypothetical protein Peur_052663 [Populus x canadensis]
MLVKPIVMSSTSNIHIQPKSTNPIPDQIEPKTPPFIHCLKSTIYPSLPKSLPNNYNQQKNTTYK